MQSSKRSYTISEKFYATPKPEYKMEQHCFEFRIQRHSKDPYKVIQARNHGESSIVLSLMIYIIAHYYRIHLLLQILLGLIAVCILVHKLCVDSFLATVYHMDTIPMGHTRGQVYKWSRTLACIFLVYVGGSRVDGRVYMAMWSIIHVVI